MDIVKRAYLKTLEESKGRPAEAVVIVFDEMVREEVKRLIKVRAYDRRDWPREFGPLPDDLRSRRKEVSNGKAG